jgi:hypothetical protein
MQPKRLHDLIPNHVETVQGQSSYEKESSRALINAHSAAYSALRA